MSEPDMSSRPGNPSRANKRGLRLAEHLAPLWRHSPDEWSGRQHWGVAAMTVVLVAISVYGVWYAIKVPVRAALTRAEMLARRELDARHARVEQLPVLRAIHERAHDTASAVAARLPKEDGSMSTSQPVPETWSADVDALAVHHKLTFDAMQPLGQQNLATGLQHSAQWRLRGAFHDAVRFLDAVARLPRIVSIERFDLTTRADGASSIGETGTSVPVRLTADLAAYEWKSEPSPHADDMGGADISIETPHANVSTDEAGEVLANDSGLADISVPLPELPLPNPPLILSDDIGDPFAVALSATRGALVGADHTGREASGGGASTSMEGAQWRGVVRYGARTVAIEATGRAVIIEDLAVLPPSMRHMAETTRDGTVSLQGGEADLAAALRALAMATGLGLIVGDRVKGRVDIALRDVSPRRALDILVRASGLALRDLGEAIWVAPRADVLADERQALEARAKRDALVPLASRRFVLNYARVAELQKVLMGEKGHRLLSARGNLIADARTNQLFVSDLPEKLDEVTAFIERIDVPIRQVLIEARIVEADDRFSRNLGIKLAGHGGAKATGSASGLREGATSGEGAMTAGNATLPASNLAGFAAPSLAITLFRRSVSTFLQLELSALEAEGKGRVVSRPRVVTADKVQAIIEQGTELPYSQRGGRRATTVQFRKASLRLEVTPQITPDGRVILDVDVSKDSVGQATADGLAIDTKHVKTQVQVESGGTVAIGGIYQQEQLGSAAQIPGLGDLPVIGGLFRNRSAKDQRTELLVFLTPTVVPEHGELMPEGIPHPTADSMSHGPSPGDDSGPLGTGRPSSLTLTERPRRRREVHARRHIPV